MSRLRSVIKPVPPECNHRPPHGHLLDPTFVDKFLSSIYVDDVVLGSNDVESTYELYVKSKLQLAAAGFKLRKFVTNSDELHRPSTMMLLVSSRWPPLHHSKVVRMLQRLH